MIHMQTAPQTHRGTLNTAVQPQCKANSGMTYVGNAWTDTD